jgi:dimethylhistidine N-methyltransferase
MTPHANEHLQFMHDMQTALSQWPKSISPKFFYDQAGSALFDRICALPEYYPTRIELALLQTHAADIAQCMGEHADIIEFGAGSLKKIWLLLKAAQQPARYVPMDISGVHLETASLILQQEFPHLRVQPLVADYTQDWQLPAALPHAGKRVAFFPGSTIGNFSPAQAHAFFNNCARNLSGGALLLGVDLIKSPDVLHAAYNDAQGLTAAFNLNLLTRANRELGCDFDLTKFADNFFKGMRAVSANAISTAGNDVWKRRIGDCIVSPLRHVGINTDINTNVFLHDFVLFHCWSLNLSHLKGKPKL